MLSSRRNGLAVMVFCLVVICIQFSVGCAAHAGAQQSVQDAAQAKYLFLFIGDGMGLAQRYAAELYASGSAGAERPDAPRLLMSSFPVQGVAATCAVNSLVTDSAAAGTALASGFKTSNGTLSMSADGALSFRTIAEAARDRGMKVGIVSTVSINDATPAAFYAHQSSRASAWEIAMEQAASGFDYFGGGGMGGDSETSRRGRPSPMEEARRNGYSVATNRTELLALTPGDGKTIAYQRGATSMRYELDRPEDYANLADFTRKGIELLDNPRSFFMMVEGGRIDGACHAHDAASAIGDVIALDQAVAEAYAFLQRHPAETLIVVTADHETGGLMIAPGGMDCRGFYQRVKLQTTSMEAFLGRLGELTGRGADVAEALALVKQSYGLMAADDADVAALKAQAEAGDQEAKARLGLVLSPTELTALKRAWELTLLGPAARAADPEVRALYGTRNPVASECTTLASRKAGIEWMTYGHTGIPVPVMAVGVGQEKFGGQYDDTDVARRLMSLIGVEPQATAPKVLEPVGAADGPS